MKRPESAQWNRPYRKQERCVPVAGGLTDDPPILYADGEPVGAGYVMPREPRWNPNTTVHSACVKQPGCVRIDMSETVVRADGSTLYFHKGGQGYEPGTVPYGHVDAAVLRAPGRAVFSADELDSRGAEPRNRNGHGAGRAAPVTDVALRIRPRPIGPAEAERAWLYKDAKHYPGKSLSGARYSKYGEAGPTQGARDQSFAYLCWSWLRQHHPDGDPRHEVSGGGAVRALLRPGQLVQRCDVPSITTPAWDRRGGKPIGQVKAIYVRASFAGSELYGWIVHSHEPRDGEPLLHVERA